MGKKARVPVVLMVAAACASCAMIGGGTRGPSAESELERGAAAARAQDYATARTILEPVYRAHYMDKAGTRALMLLTAIDLDPRNANRRLSAASDYATTLLNSDAMPVWEKPVAETLYLLSVELGGLEQEIGRAEAAKDSAQNLAAAARRANLPSSPRESWPAQLRKMREERDAMSKRLETLQTTVRTRDRELAEAKQELAGAKQELERIKKTLKIK